MIQPGQAKNIVTKKLVKSVAEVSLDRVKETRRIRHTGGRLGRKAHDIIRYSGVLVILRVFVDLKFHNGHKPLA